MNQQKIENRKRDSIKISKLTIAEFRTNDEKNRKNERVAFQKIAKSGYRFPKNRKIRVEVFNLLTLQS